MDEKIFYAISEVAEIVGVKPYVLRYWETEFNILNPQKSVTGQRNYRKKDIEVALTIKRLLYDEKYTIAGAIQKLEELEKMGLDRFEHGRPGPASSDSFNPEPVQKAQSFSPKSEVLEKIRELKALLNASFEILKKYDLV